MNQFTDLSLSPILQRNLVAGGFKLPTPVQAQAIPSVLEGRDVVASAQTGTGKTLAFLLTMLEIL
jgi:ATP-dependent RNA helicase RhlE